MFQCEKFYVCALVGVLIKSRIYCSKIMQNLSVIQLQIIRNSESTRNVTSLARPSLLTSL